MRIFDSQAVQNGYLGNEIYSICKKTIQDEIGQGFLMKSIKDTLHAYSLIETQKKNPKVAQPQPMYFAVKGNS